MPTAKTPSLLSVMCTLLLTLATALAADENGAKTLRAGMIGLDTSHVPAFTKIFNAANATGDVSGIRIVAGYPGGTDIPASRDRVGKFTEEIRAMGVEIVPTIPALLEKVDVVLLESVDGRIHWKEAAPVILAGKPLFIDKPVAGSLADAIAIYDLARERGVPCFSSSSLRYYATVRGLQSNTQLGEIAGVATWGPCTYQEGMPDMFFYGIHGIEVLFTLMGPGCETVARAYTTETDHLTGVWKDGRIGTFRGIRANKAGYGAVVYGSKGIIQTELSGGYEDLCREIGRFFKTGRAPVPASETIEIFAFMEAADESKRRNGAPVALAELIEKARTEAKKKREALSFEVKR